MNGPYGEDQPLIDFLETRYDEGPVREMSKEDYLELAERCPNLFEEMMEERP